MSAFTSRVVRFQSVLFLVAAVLGGSLGGSLAIISARGLGLMTVNPATNARLALVVLVDVIVLGAFAFLAGVREYLRLQQDHRVHHGDHRRHHQEPAVHVSALHGVGQHESRLVVSTCSLGHHFHRGISPVDRHHDHAGHDDVDPKRSAA